MDNLEKLKIVDHYKKYTQKEIIDILETNGFSLSRWDSNWLILQWMKAEMAKDEPDKCQECGSKEEITCGTNPFRSYENLWLCDNCINIPFSQMKNVKYFDASTDSCEGNENFKKCTYSEED